MSRNHQTKMAQYGSFSQVVNGQEYAQQNFAGHAQYQPQDLRYQYPPQAYQPMGGDNSARTDCGCGGPGKCGGRCGCGPSCGCKAAVATCLPGPEPSAYFPYAGNTRGAAAYDSAYPNEEDMSSQYPRGCPSAVGYELNVNSLMPASWRAGSVTDSAVVDGSQWSKYAPTRESFDRYITAQGSARLSLATRSPLGRIVGIPDLLRQAPPMPLSASEISFIDSENRLDAIYSAVGRYPTSTEC